MTPLEMANMALGIVLSVGTTISLIAIGVRWLVKHYFEEIKKEFKPNGGSSLKDQVNRLEKTTEHSERVHTETLARVERVERKVEDLYDKFIEYIAKKDN
jgi:hypothetical protein